MQFPDGLPQAVDRFPHIVLALLALALLYRLLRTRAR